MIVQRKPRKNAPYKWFYLSKVYHSFWACPCDYLHVIIFPPTRHFVSLLSICLCKFIYTKSEVQGLVLATGPWGLVPRIQSFLCLSLTSISVQETKILLQAAAGWVAWDQNVHNFIQWTTLHSAKATTFKNHHFRVGENEFSDYKDFIYFNENIINILSLFNFLLYSNLNE